MLAKIGHWLRHRHPNQRTGRQAQRALRRLGGWQTMQGARSPHCPAATAAPVTNCQALSCLCPRCIPHKPEHVRKAPVPAQDWQVGHTGSLPRTEMCLLNMCGYCNRTIRSLSLQRTNQTAPLKGLEQVSMVAFGVLRVTEAHISSDVLAEIGPMRGM